MEIIRATLTRKDVVVEVALHQNPGDFVPLLGLLHGERAYNLGHLLAPEEQLDGDRVPRVVELDLEWKENIFCDVCMTLVLVMHDENFKNLSE